MDIDTLEKMIRDGHDSAMLRLTLARLLSVQGRRQEAVVNLASAVRQDATYTAAWKALGQAQLDLGDQQQAADAWQQGIEVARQNGDKQAEREMAVFLKRLRKTDAPSTPSAP